MAKQVYRPLAVFHWKKYRSINDFIAKVRSIIQNLENKPLIYPFPRPTIAILKADLSALVVLQAKVKARSAKASTRNLKYDKVRKDVLTLLGYVQELADATTAEKAISIIVGSGFSLKQKPPRGKLSFELKQGKSTGEVRLKVIAAAKRASYEWQKSLDGVRWTELPVTIIANTVARDLAEGSKVFFRYRATTKDGTGGWINCGYIIVR